MVTMRNVYMAANLLIQQHGQDASIFAAMNADSLADRGDLAGKTLWMRVLSAIKELRRTHHRRTPACIDGRPRSQHQSHHASCGTHLSGAVTVAHPAARPSVDRDGDVFRGFARNAAIENSGPRQALVSA